MATHSDLVGLVEDAAAGLVRFRDSLPVYATTITTIIPGFFDISSILRCIQDGTGTRRYGPSFYRIRDDLDLVYHSLRMTLDVVFDMFARTLDRPTRLAWEDSAYRFDHDESCDLQTRLETYRDFLHCQYKVLEGQRPEAPATLRAQIVSLLTAQEAYQRRDSRRAVDHTRESTPRPQPPRPRPRRMETPVSPTTVSDEWEPFKFPRQHPPVVPDAPDPLSPTFTSSSSQTVSSSFTSYSSDPTHVGPPLVHWAQDVFDGRHPTSEYTRDAQLDERSACYGPSEPDALDLLMREGFVKTLEINFEEDRLGVRLYWRPHDARARILVMTKDRTGRQKLYSQPLTNLKIIREDSTLQLCRLRRSGRQYALWARLNFVFHERMVLFYCAFVAMKQQDQWEIGHVDLVEECELQDRESLYSCEEVCFSGQMRHGNMLHCLRLLRDRGSGVIRLEASALRGPKKDVPIWTAFVTKYTWDPDWPYLGREGLEVCLTIRPSPYVFVTQYMLPYDCQSEQYVLPFTSLADATMLMETWVRITRLYGRDI